MKKYLEVGYNKKEYIFYQSTISGWYVSFTKLMSNYEILADFQNYKLGSLSVWSVHLPPAHKIILVL